MTRTLLNLLALPLLLLLLAIITAPFVIIVIGKLVWEWMTFKVKMLMTPYPRNKMKL
jgi:hypothetical protein